MGAEWTEELRNVIALLLEYKPKDPILYVANYFRDLKHQGKSRLQKSYAFIKATRMNQNKFLNNLSKAFEVLDNDSTDNGRANGGELLAIVRRLCVDFPPEIAECVMKILHKEEHEFICFSEFQYAIMICFLFQDYIQQVHALYKPIKDNLVVKSGRTAKTERITTICVGIDDIIKTIIEIDKKRAIQFGEATSTTTRGEDVVTYTAEAATLDVLKAIDPENIIVKEFTSSSFKLSGNFSCENLRKLLRNHSSVCNNEITFEGFLNCLSEIASK